MPGYLEIIGDLPAEEVADGVNSPVDSIADVFHDLADLFHGLADGVADSFADLLTDSRAVFSKEKAAYSAGIEC
jgi:hypothetical protein